MKIFSARFSPEEERRLKLMAALDVEFPDGASSVIRDGVAAMWDRYGKLAEMMAHATARVREEAGDV